MNTEFNKEENLTFGACKKGQKRTRYGLKAYKETLPKTLTQEQQDIIIGTLLGDASMSQRRGKPVYSIKFEQRALNYDYVYHLYEVFESFVGTGPTERWIDKKHTRKAIWFRTYQHDNFIYYYNFFYPRLSSCKKKIVPKDIAKFLTPRAVAYWFMDDGSSKNRTGNSEAPSAKRISYVFNTQGFEKHECERLADALRKNFGIICNVWKDKKLFQIGVLADSTEVLRQLMEPYIHKNFKYKLNGDKASKNS